MLSHPSRKGRGLDGAQSIEGEPGVKEPGRGTRPPANSAKDGLAGAEARLILLTVSAQLEHYSDSCTQFRVSLNQAFASCWVMRLRASVMAWSRASLVRAFAERSSCLSLAHAFSMGFRSGE